MPHHVEISSTAAGEVRDATLDAVFRGDLGTALDGARVLLRTGTSLAQLYSGVLQPFLDEIGRGWQAGTLCIADEHRCSSTVEALIGNLALGGAPRHPRGTILLVPGPGEQHTLGLMMVAHAWQEAGWRVERTYALPVAELPAYLAGLPDPQLVGISLSDLPGTEPLRTQLAALRQALPRVPLLLGGLAVRRHADLAEQLDADATAPDVDTALRLAEQLTNPLTRREQDILVMISNGNSNEAIGAELGVNVATVKTHLDHVYTKLHVHDRAAAVAKALRSRWIH